jgi:Fe(3+) dicitrate transport protein
MSVSAVSRARLLLGAASLVCAAALPAHAAEEAENRQPDILVIGTEADRRALPGTATTIDTAVLEAAVVFTVDEALRKAGVFTRLEEGLGLRPNIGLRGLDPTRSRKVLLLEDGIPLAHSPYGDNSSYYHPPIDRFAAVEVLKGAGQIAYGPHTVGGVINYVTPSPTEDLSGKVKLAGGNRGYSELGVQLSDTVGGWGLAGVLDRRRAEGARRNVSSEMLDLSVKARREFGDDRSLTLRASHNVEDSRVPYSGLRLAEFEADPRQNPFINDSFETHRTGASATWAQPVAGFETKTTAYWSTFERDWWRQSSNSNQRPNDASDPACAGMANLLTTCGNEGRLRSYYVAGLEPRAERTFSLGGLTHHLHVGARYHIERQHRVQLNGDTPTARSAGTWVNAGTRENDVRDTTAWSAFALNRISAGPWVISPGVRVEHITAERKNRLTGRSGETDLTEAIPGVGVTYSLNENVALFGGVHRGFSPPQVADLVTSSGGAVDLDAELSWNWEAGVRGLFGPATVEAALFHLDFENQIIPASVAGGVGATLTSAGETRSTGLDVNATLNADAPGIYGQLAWVWLWEAEFAGNRFSNISGQSGVRVTGNRLPYAPEHLVSLTAGWRGQSGWTAQVEWVHTGALFTDDLNTRAVTADGQTGEIPSASVFNFAGRVPLAVLMGEPADGLELFVAVKNLTDELYVVDRSRGTIPGDPRRVQAGVTLKF